MVDGSKPSWKLRRRATFSAMAFGAFIVLYVAVRWDDLRIAETLALGGFGLIGAALATYTGSAAYEDVRLHKQNNYGGDHGHY